MLQNKRLKYVLISLVNLCAIKHHTDGWMTSFSTVFQSYQDDERMIIMKGCVQWNFVLVASNGKHYALLVFIVGANSEFVGKKIETYEQSK